jgi:hypothetical protein
MLNAKVRPHQAAFFLFWPQRRRGLSSVEGLPIPIHPALR